MGCSHVDIVSSCSIAHRSLSNALASFRSLSSSPSVHAQPWTLAASSHAQDVERAIGACGDALGRIKERIGEKEKSGGCGQEVKKRFKDCQVRPISLSLCSSSVTPETPLSRTSTPTAEADGTRSTTGLTTPRLPNTTLTLPRLPVRILMDPAKR